MQASCAPVNADFAAFCGCGGLVRGRAPGGRAAGHGGVHQRAGRRGLAPVHDLGGLQGHRRRAGRASTCAIGGEIRSHYDPKGSSGDAETIVNEILAYEPERMLAIRIKQAPASLPHRDARRRHTGPCCTSIPPART